MRRQVFLLTAVTAVVAAAWMPAGETYNPTLSWQEMPANVVRGCLRGPTAGPDGFACTAPESLRSRWVGRSPRGDLFLVTVPGCAGSECGAWFVERGAAGAAVLLAVRGEITLSHGDGAYPEVRTRVDVSPVQVVYSQYEWTGERYIRAEDRAIFRVDGVECGTQEQCRGLAREALRLDRVDRAVKIWENVYGVSWI
jgi:hypothetical protein